MLEWLSEIAGPGYATAIVWTLGALLLLVVVMVGIRIFKSLTFGTYVAGGRHRRHRLAVSDAAAVDSHRRLVLVRRDEVEHLILIGGPTDVVIEQNIRIAASDTNHTATPAINSAPETPPEPRPQPVRQARPVPPPAVERPQPRPAAAAAPAAPIRPVTPPPVRPMAQQPAPASVTAPNPVQVQARHQSAAPATVETATGKSNADDIDSALLEELNVALDRPAGTRASGEACLEDEMSRLLGDLSDTKRA